MPALTEYPQWLQKACAKFSDEFQAKLSSLFDKYHFNADALDAFELNNGDSVKPETLPDFVKFLESEHKTKTNNSDPKVPQQRRASRSGGLQTSTKTPRKVNVPKGLLGSILGNDQPDIITPDPKRRRETHADDIEATSTTLSFVADAAVGEPAQGTPDPPSKPVLLSVRTYLNEQIVKPIKVTSGSVPLQVEILGDHRLWQANGVSNDRPTYDWMDESIEERSVHLDERLAVMEREVAAELCKRHATRCDGSPPPLGTVGATSQAEVVICGRIACEGLEGKLNERSILLEGSRALSGGASVRLNVAECPALAAFPGQIVGVLGRSGMSGTTFHSREIVSGLAIPSKVASRGESPLHVIVAAGPYCLRDGLAYNPLERVLEHAAQEKPNVFMLLGPFLDASNAQVAKGAPTLPGDEEPCAFEDVYNQHVLKLLHRGLALLKRASPDTQVLLVPSVDEVLCFHPMPQPPLNKSLGLNDAMEPLRRLGVHFLPNPAHIRIGGLRVSVTSSDALSPLIRDLVLRPQGNKIHESLSQLLRQRTLFPVLPRDPPQVSEARASALNFPENDVPDVCIFPSIIGGLTGMFVDDVAFVNPGFVCRPAALGTFAEFWVTPPCSGEPLSERVRVDIQKLS